MSHDRDVVRLTARIILFGSLLVPVAVGAQLPDASFRHDLHRELGCLDCHAMQADHGALLVADAFDCRSCHHVRERDRGCAACHRTGELNDDVHSGTLTFDLSVFEEPVQRVLEFSHEPHEERACAECHVGDDATLTPSDLDCASCHQEHHVATSSGCMECHRDPGGEVHTLEVHETCSGSGCHVAPPFDASPPTRTGCLWCHQDMTDHRPERRCVDCHFPAGGGQATQATPADPGRLPVLLRSRYLHVPHRHAGRVHIDAHLQLSGDTPRG